MDYKEKIIKELRLYLKESSGLNPEEQKIFTTCKEYLKKHATWKDDEICTDAIPCIADGHPAIAVYFWSSGTAETYSLDISGWKIIYPDSVKLSHKPKIEEDKTSYLPGGKKKTMKVEYFLLKTSISIDIVNDLLLANKFKQSDIDITDNIVKIEYSNKSDEKKITSIFDTFKNVKIEFGGYYADVDNKHFVSIAQLTIK